MLETDKVFAGSIPENYDRYMVPLILSRTPWILHDAQRPCRQAPFWKPPRAAGLSPARWRHDCPEAQAIS